MNIGTYTRHKKMQKLSAELLAVEEDRTAGRNGCAIDKLDKDLNKIITNVKYGLL